MAEEQPGITTEQQAVPVPEPAKKSRLWKWAKRIFWSLTIFILTVFIAAGCILYFFGDNIKQYAIEQLNSYLNTRVYIDPKNIDFTVLQNFPNASVDFKEVEALEVSDSEKKDKLLHAGKISFQFNIMDIFHGKYDIKKVVVADADLHLKVDKKGKDNYHFLKESGDTTASKFEFSLEEFVLDNVRVDYVNKKNKYTFGGLLHRADLEGKFSSDSYSLSTNGKLFVDHLKEDSTDYLPQKNIDLDLVLAVDNVTDTYTFSKGDLKVEDLFLEMTGCIVHHEKEDAFNLAVKGKDMNIQSVLSLVPAKNKVRISDYASEGNFYFSAALNGSLSDTKTPVIRASFGIKEGEISQSGSSVKLKDVSLTGKYFSGSDAEKKKSALDIDNFSCTLGGGTINGHFRLDDLENPFISVKANASIGLAELQQFLKLDTIEQISGDLKLNASFNGSIKEAKKYIAEDFKNAETSGQMSLSSVNAKLRGNPLALKDLNGAFTFRNNDLEVNSFSGSVSNSDFEMKGYFRNILSYIFLEKEDLVVDASFRSKQIDLNELLSDKSKPGTDTAYNLVFPEHVDLNLQTSIDKIDFRQFEAVNISGGIRIKDKKLVADPVTLRTMGGRITSSVMVDGSQGSNFLITCDAKLDHLDLAKVFTEFENFGQDYLVDKNLKGVATATVQFASIWSPKLVVDPDKVYALCDILVENGKLIGMQPIIDIAKDMKKDFWMKRIIDCDEFERRLKTISFPAMSNKVEIKGQKISFTPMTLKSSALDMEFSGWHKFNNDIEYNFSFPLSGLPLQSEKKRKEANKEFGEEESEQNGMMIYYKLTGNVDKEIIYDKDRTTKKKMKEEKKEKEKQNLKQILKDEFGWFKKDSSLTDKKGPDKKKDPKKDDGKFIIKWDDEEKKDKKKDDEDQ
jgi:uncharacterized protein involved in outer membrane biogenesis